MTPADPDFESRYREDPDPFKVRTSRYERRKLAVVLATLTQPRYRRAWDAACGTGDLAHALVDVAGEVLATDAAPTAARLAGELLGEHGTARACALPADPGVRDVDLVVLSEVLYYLDEGTRSATYDLVDRVAAADAELVAVSWRHHPHDTHLSGEDATTELVARLTGTGWRVAARHDDTDFLSVHLVRGRLATPSPGDEA